MDVKTYEYMKSRVDKYNQLKQVKARLSTMRDARIDASNNYRLKIEGHNKSGYLSGDADSKFIKIICKSIDEAIDECIKALETEMEAI